MSSRVSQALWASLLTVCAFAVGCSSSPRGAPAKAENRKVAPNFSLPKPLSYRIAWTVDVQIANSNFSVRPLPRRVVHDPDLTATEYEDKFGTLGADRSLTLISAYVINTPNLTLASRHRLPPGYPCNVDWVLAARCFDTLVPMPLAFIYSFHDSLSALICAEVCQATFSRPRSRCWRICSHSLSPSSAADTESAVHISTICRKVVTRPR